LSWIDDNHPVESPQHFCIAIYFFPRAVVVILVPARRPRKLKNQYTTELIRTLS